MRKLKTPDPITVPCLSACLLRRLLLGLMVSQSIPATPSSQLSRSASRILGAVVLQIASVKWVRLCREILYLPTISCQELTKIRSSCILQNYYRPRSKTHGGKVQIRRWQEYSIDKDIMNDICLSSKDTYPPKVRSLPSTKNVADYRAKGASAASAAFQSLVERSIIAWNSLNYVGVDQAVVVRKHIDMLRNLSSMETLLENRQFWFFQLKESFIQQKLLMKWDPVRLDEYILLPIHYGFVNNQDCFFVSHYWHAREHPDPEGHDMCLFLKDLAQMEWSYIWVDWTCMPQDPRSEVQRTYFKKMLQCIPILVRDSAFAWRFPTFEPRAWILFEVAEYVLNHAQPTFTNDLAPFISHVVEMVKDGVRPVVSKYGYVCTNGGDLPLVIGWLEVLIILVKVVPNIGTRQEILDWINRNYVGSYSKPALGIEIDKARGVISCNGTTYEFTPVFLP